MKKMFFVYFEVTMEMLIRFATSYLLVALADQAVYDFTTWYGFRDPKLVWAVALIVFAIRNFIRWYEINKL